MVGTLVGNPGELSVCVEVLLSRVTCVQVFAPVTAKVNVQSNCQSFASLDNRVNLPNLHVFLVLSCMQIYTH